MGQMKNRDEKEKTQASHSPGDPFSADSCLDHSCCSGDHTHPAAAKTTEEEVIDHVVESAIVRAIFNGNEVTRRRFMQVMGSATAMAVISEVFPLDMAKAWAKDDAGPLEKPDLKIGFIPITCATPIIAAQALGIFEKHGLSDAALIKGSGWGGIRDWTYSKKVDCTHMLSPMPIAMTLGIGSEPLPTLVAALENVNGQAVTLANKHKGVKDFKEMKGFTLCVPFEYSMHNLLLRMLLANAGLDPDKQVTIKTLPPPEMVVQLKAGNIDGFLSPEPFNQRAVYEGVGFIFKVSKDVWAGHPCCAFATTKEFATKSPNTYKATLKAIVEATVYAHKAENRESVAQAISGRDYLNQPVEVLKQVLTGKFPDGLGNTLNVPDRIDFDPFPWQSMAVWIMSQMKRWGYIKKDVDYKKIAEEVFMAGDCAKAMKELGIAVPDSAYKKHVIMGKEFDASAI